MTTNKNVYAAPRTDWALTIGTALATIAVVALLYAPLAHWRGLLV